jgi:hypothetical protein
MGGKKNKKQQSKRKPKRNQNQKQVEASESDFDVVQVNENDQNILKSESEASANLTENSTANLTENSSPDNEFHTDVLSQSDVLVERLANDQNYEVNSNQTKGNHVMSLLSSAVAKSSQSTPSATPVRINSNNQSTSATTAYIHQTALFATPAIGLGSRSKPNSSKSSSSAYSTSKSKDIPITSKKLFDSPDHAMDRSSPSSHSYKRNNQFAVSSRSISRSPADALLSKSIPKAIPRRASQSSPSHLPKIATPSSLFANQLNMASSNEGKTKLQLLMIK